MELTAHGKFIDGVVVVEMSGKFGYMTEDKKLLTPLKYSDASKFKEDRATVKLGSKYSIIDKSGKELIDFIYDEIYPFSNDYAVVIKGSKYGYINLEGIEVVPIVLDYASDTNARGIAIVERKGQEVKLNVKEYKIK